MNQHIWHNISRGISIIIENVKYFCLNISNISGSIRNKYVFTYLETTRFPNEPNVVSSENNLQARE